MRKKITLLFVFGVISVLSFGQIFITELADPNDETGARYVELFNNSDTDVDLGAEGYGLNRYTNGNADPQLTVYYLTGTIPAKGFYIIAAVGNVFTLTYGFEPDQEIGTGGPADSNGDDQILLVKVGADTMVVDIFGVPNEDGSNTCHEFEDGRAERIASVTTANGGTWDEANWNVWSDGSTAAGCTNHISDSPINTGDGIFDPGLWIGNPSTYLFFESLSTNLTEDGGTSFDVCVKILAPDPLIATTVEVNIDAMSTAVNGTDFSSITTPIALTFPAGSTDSQCFTITITDDTDEELDESILLYLQNPTGGAAVTVGRGYKVKIYDDDIVGPNAGDLIFTEIMQNPDMVLDGEGEWFEILNTTESEIDLYGIRIVDEEILAEGFQITTSLVIPAGEYFLFANNGDAALNGSLPTPDYIFKNEFPALGNGEDGIVIQCGMTMIDSVVWDGVIFPDPTGASMSLMIDHLNSVDNDNGANWEVATSVYGDGDLGTPGAANIAVCDLQIGASTATCDASTSGLDTYTVTIDYTLGATSTYVITTTAGTIGGDDPSVTASGTISITGIDEGTDVMVTVDNSAVSGACILIEDIVSPICFNPVCAEVGSVIFTEIMQNPAAVQDEFGEWFELKNNSPNDIDIQGWSIVDDDHTLAEEGFTFLTSLIIPSGGYVIIANNGDAATNGGLPTPDYVYEYGFPFLGNGVDGVQIMCSDQVIDVVVWDGGVTFPAPSGASMALDIAHQNATDNDDGANWAATTVGTYGAGDFGTPGEANSTVSVGSTEMSSFTVYPNPVSKGVFKINFTNEAKRSIQIYNLLGKQVYNKSYSNNELISVSDLKAGLYILNVTEEGKSISHKLIIQ